MFARLSKSLSKRLSQPTFMMAMLMLTGLLGTGLLTDMASSENDARYRSLSIGLVDRVIQAQREQLGLQLADYAIWNDLYLNLRGPQPNYVWLKSNFTGTIYTALKINIGALYDDDGQPVYEIRDGKILDHPDGAMRFAPDEWKHLRRVVERYDPYGKDGYPTFLLQKQSQLYFVALQKVVPEHDNTSAPPSLPHYTLFARKLDSVLLNRLIKSYGIQDLQVCARPDRNTATLQLTGIRHEPLATLCWHQTLPGQSLLENLLPRSLVLLLVIGLLALLVLRRAQQVDIRHSAITDRLAEQGKTLRELVVHPRHDIHDNADGYLTTLVEAIAATLQVERVSLWRYDSERQTLECFAALDVAGACELTGEVLPQATHNDYFHAMLDHRFLASEHVIDDPRLASMKSYLVRNGIGAMLDAGIRFGNQLHGVLCVENRAARNWHQDEINFICSAADVVALVLESGARKRAEGELYRQFYYDRFTGLPNRARLLMQLEELLAPAKARPFGCLLIALEGLSSINTLYGREFGDLLIGSLCERLERFLHPGEMVARSSDNRFCVVVLEQDATAICERTKALFDALALPIRVAGQNHSPQLHGGLVVYPDDLTDAQAAHQMLECSELALQAIRSQTGSGWLRFETGMSEEWRRRHQLIRDLGQAAKQGQLVLHYQPYLDAKLGVVRGAEALLRWQHPERGLVSPGEFIPLAEESGLIGELGDWALVTACTQAIEWQRAGHLSFAISVNVSLMQLENEHFSRRVRDVLHETGLPASSLELEVTETLALRHSPTIDQNVETLRALGVRLAIDDFGTGYASFSYLRRFPVEKLKIDREFLEFVPDNPQSASLVRMIIAMGHALGAQVTGEGVENIRQQAFLAEAGCDLVQGFHLSRPLSVEAMTLFLASQSVAQTAG
jgi:EAL domain-containing protein (putative c-di-GMP-specific phosphodiesterase class I)/GGDEF domain-containing protein/sensor domain CHASE-containing protein